MSKRGSKPHFAHYFQGSDLASPQTMHIAFNIAAPPGSCWLLSFWNDPFDKVGAPQILNQGGATARDKLAFTQSLKYNRDR